MKLIILALALITLTEVSSQPVDRQQMREWFLQSMQRKSALDSFMSKLEKLAIKTPAQECYYGICYALSTQYTSGMWAKIKLVNESHSVLNHAIARDPQDPELRFIRLTLEHFLPAFLGMSKDIPSDLAVIMAHPDFVSDSPPLKKKALEFLISTHRCNADQNKALEQQLAGLNKRIQGGLAMTSIQ